MVALYSDASGIGVIPGTRSAEIGWAFALVDTKKQETIAEGSGTIKGTVAKAELFALHMGLIAAVELDVKEVTGYSDSKYVVEGINTWISRWIENGWRTMSGGDVKNINLWKEILEIEYKLKKMNWVKSHSGNKWNDYVDVLAKIARSKKVGLKLKKKWIKTD